jgi:hypothetical protein
VAVIAEQQQLQGISTHVVMFVLIDCVDIEPFELFDNDLFSLTQYYLIHPHNIIQSTGRILSTHGEVLVTWFTMLGWPSSSTTSSAMGGHA